MEIKFKSPLQNLEELSLGHVCITNNETIYPKDAYQILGLLIDDTTLNYKLAIPHEVCVGDSEEWSDKSSTEENKVSVPTNEVVYIRFALSYTDAMVLDFSGGTAPHIIDWDLPNITSMQFFNVKELPDNIPPRVTSIVSMLVGANNPDYSGRNIHKWDFKNIKDATRAFVGLPFQDDQSNIDWKFPQLVEGRAMLDACKTFNGKISELNLLYKATEMFRGCARLTLEELHLPEVQYTEQMFSGCVSMNTKITGLQKLFNALYMFRTCSKFNQPLPPMPLLANADSMFDTCTSYNQPLEDLSGVQIASSMFTFAINFNQPMPDMPLLFNADAMFYGATSFNSSLGDMSAITTAYRMFASASKFNQVVPSMPLLANAGSMFDGARSFNQTLPNLDKVTAVKYLLRNASSYKQALDKAFVNMPATDITGLLDTSGYSGIVNLNTAVEYTGLSRAFASCPLNATSNLGEINVSAVPESGLTWTFYESTYKGDLSPWCVEHLSEEPENFGGAELVAPPKWGEPCTK